MKLWYVAALLCGAVAASSVHATVAVDVKAEHIVCQVKLGRHRAPDDAVLSPDGHTVAYIRFIKSNDMPDGKSGVLWIGDCRTGTTRLLLPAPFAGKDGNEQWTTLDRPVFSLDGRQVYVNAAYGGDSLLLQRIDLATGRHAYVLAAGLLGIIRNGPYRGDFLARQHTLLKDRDGSEYGGYSYYVFSPQGTAVKRIPDSENWSDDKLDAWLRRQGWRIQ